MTNRSGAGYFALPGLMDVLAAQCADQRFAPHFHDTFTFGAIVKGECHFHRSGVPFVAREGDLFVIHPYELHTGGTRRHGLQYRAIYPSSAWLRQFLPSGSAGELPWFPSPVFRDPDSAALLRAMESVQPGGEPAPTVHVRAIERLLAAIVRRHADGVRQFPDHSQAGPRIGLACRLLQQHWAEDVSSLTLARKVGLSRFHFIRLFRGAVGLTPGAYARNIRISQAKHLIQAGRGVAEAALVTRFSDQSHLTREFKRIYGISPGMVGGRRRSNRVQDEPPHFRLG